MEDRIEQNALELLHAIRERHPDIYAGAWVNPYTAALEAGLNPDSTHYRVAMEYLQAQDVLEEAEESRELGGGGPLYTLTLRGMEMLREVRFRRLGPTPVALGRPYPRSRRWVLSEVGLPFYGVLRS